MSSHDCSFLFNALDAQMYISDMLRYIQVRWSGGTSERVISG